MSLAHFELYNYLKFQLVCPALPLDVTAIVETQRLLDSYPLRQMENQAVRMENMGRQIPSCVSFFHRCICEFLYWRVSSKLLYGSHAVVTKTLTNEDQTHREERFWMEVRRRLVSN